MPLPKQVEPYYYAESDWAIRIGNRLVLIPPDLTAQYKNKHTIVQISRTIFGMRIPFLPDKISSPNLFGSNKQERLFELWQQRNNLITILGKWKLGRFSLRYLWNPDDQNISINLLASGLAAGEGEEQISGKIFEDISRAFEGQDYPIEPITQEIELRHCINPIPEGYIVEVRQKEMMLKMVRGSAYVVYSYGISPYNTWITLFRLICNQTSPCMINFHLEPTTLTEEESSFIAGAAQFAATLSHENYEGYSGKYEFDDPVARTVAGIYNGFLQRFHEPFLAVTQVVSEDSHVARNVAQGIIAEVTAEVVEHPPIQEEGQMPIGAELALPSGEDELEAARRTLTSLCLTPWGASDARSEQQRLPYLVDSKTASSLFRFPVALRGGIPGIRTRQVVPGQEMGNDPSDRSAEEVFLGQFLTRGGKANIPTAYLNRHVLVAGTTGSGKTTTCFKILSQLWQKGVPFLVIEPQKTEYRAFVDSTTGGNVQVFTLGDEGIAPFRLNPLEIFPGVRVETHISHIRACFEAALPTFGILPSLIEESLLKIYQAKGWHLTDRGQDADPRLMPTLGELYSEIISVTNQRGYSEKTAQDIRAAASGRIGTLLRGSKGRMLNTRRSLPIEQWMTTPTILELESLNDEEKALVMLFLLTAIREYCRIHRSTASLKHVTLIEEAHRVMANTGHVGNREIQADTSAAAVGMASSTLSEVRSYGEGIIIAEQIPTRLIEDALKNTNLKIVHRLPGKDDREQVGATMNMEQEQEDYLIKLEPGQAAIYMEGYERPAFIQVDDFRKNSELPVRVSEARVIEHMKRNLDEYGDSMHPFVACHHCLKQCKFRDRLSPIVYDVEVGTRFSSIHSAFVSALKAKEDIKGWQLIAEDCKSSLERYGLSKDVHAAYCFIAHLWPTEFSQSMSLSFRQAFLGAR